MPSPPMSSGTVLTFQNTYNHYENYMVDTGPVSIMKQSGLCIFEGKLYTAHRIQAFPSIEETSFGLTRRKRWDGKRARTYWTELEDSMNNPAISQNGQVKVIANKFRVYHTMNFYLQLDFYFMRNKQPDLFPLDMMWLFRAFSDETPDPSALPENYRLLFHRRNISFVNVPKKMTFHFSCYKMKFNEEINLFQVAYEDDITWRWQKIQKFLRHMLFRRRQAKLLAICMGMHKRLGAKSVLRGLETDIVKMIMS